MRFITVESLIPATERNKHKWGGMSLSYTGKLMELWAQISLRGTGKHGSADVVFSVINGIGANRQDAVWWMPKNGIAEIALGNSSDMLIHSDLQFSNGDIESVNIGPHATKYIRRNPNDSGSTAHGESVRVITAGPDGALKAAGYVIANDSSFTSSIRFYETPIAVQQDLFATDLSLENSRVRMLLKNTSDGPVTATPHFKPKDGNGASVDLSPITLSAGEIKNVDLSTLISAAATRSDLRHVFVSVSNSGAAGSLIGALYSNDQATGLTSDPPLRDSGPLRNNTGAYPWRLDGDYQTTVVITNVGNQATRFLGAIVFDGGDFQPGSTKLNPGETKTFDIRKLRDGQTKDQFGHVIPTTATKGQFRWSVTRSGPNDQGFLIGRSQVKSQLKHESISYSCAEACVWSGPYYSSCPMCSLPNFDLGIDESSSATLEAGFVDGNGYWSYDTHGANYLDLKTLGTSDPTTATVYRNISEDLEAHGLSSGYAVWSSEFWFNDFVDTGLGYCDDQGHSDYISGNVSVTTVTITKSDGAALPSPFRLGISSTTTSGTPHNRTQHLKATVNPANQVGNVTIGVTSKVTLSNVHTANGVITFDVVGETESSTSGDSSITATSLGKTLANITVSVVVPSKVATPHDTVGAYVAENRVTDGTTSPSYNGLPSGKVALQTIYARFLTITVKDQFNALIGDIYEGAEVTETLGASNISINQSLTSSSTYSDPVGEGILWGIVDAGSATANNWSTQSLQPMQSLTQTENIAVQVDGFTLVPGVNSRTWTATPPNTLTISWP